ncbi:hypothetical protein [Streptomyces sp. NBC_01760]|uniref:hypothetical protein n=1 Tax=Streptomyces sp. NBC_01760 TaxID=2975931 RepID=UPI002DD85D99|nr:hypothetical protein [Streptomyces sp. NBC_01760]WSC72236.1 hypothetical protein OG807_29220 [Streptomyces sp. NBC_01760]
MSELRTDIWVDYPEKADDLLPFMGKHLIAYPFAQVAEKSGGQLIGVNPEERTASIRRYDTAEVTEFPWPTTKFRHTTTVESPYADLEVGAVRRFEWFECKDGYPIDTPRTLVGTVDSVQASQIVLWVRQPGYGTSGGWWAHLKNEDAQKHNLRPANLKADRKNC